MCTLHFHSPTIMYVFIFIHHIHSQLTCRGQPHHSIRIICDAHLRRSERKVSVPDSRGFQALILPPLPFPLPLLLPELPGARIVVGNIHLLRRLCRRNRRHRSRRLVCGLGRQHQLIVVAALLAAQHVRGRRVARITRRRRKMRAGGGGGLRPHHHAGVHLESAWKALKRALQDFTHCNGCRLRVRPSAIL
jgi:hypothetical protein